MQRRLFLEGLLCVCICILHAQVSNLAMGICSWLELKRRPLQNPGGMFQPNLGRRVSMTVFVFEFVSKEFFKKSVTVAKISFNLDLVIAFAPPTPSFSIYEHVVLWEIKMFASIALSYGRVGNKRFWFRKWKCKIHHAFLASLKNSTD